MAEPAEDVADDSTDNRKQMLDDLTALLQDRRAMERIIAEKDKIITVLQADNAALRNQLASLDLASRPGKDDHEAPADEQRAATPPPVAGPSRLRPTPPPLAPTNDDSPARRSRIGSGFAAGVNVLTSSFKAKKQSPAYVGKGKGRVISERSSSPPLPAPAPPPPVTPTKGGTSDCPVVLSSKDDPVQPAAQPVKPVQEEEPIMNVRSTIRDLTDWLKKRERSTTANTLSSSKPKTKKRRP